MKIALIFLVLTVLIAWPAVSPAQTSAPAESKGGAGQEIKDSWITSKTKTALVTDGREGAEKPGRACGQERDAAEQPGWSKGPLYRGPLPLSHDYMSMWCAGMRSQTRQNSTMSCGVLKDTLMYFAMEGIGGATRMLCFFKWSMAPFACPPVFSMTKFLCESMARSVLSLD